MGLRFVQMAFLAAHNAKAVNLAGVLKEGWDYMESLRYKMRNNARVFQPSVSPIWDTARVLSGLQYIPESLKVNKLKNNSPQVKKALQFLLSEQDIDGGDYKMANPDFVPGGWGFAYGSNKYPDSDDTAMVIDALIPLAKDNAKVSLAVKKAFSGLFKCKIMMVDFLLGTLMQRMLLSTLFKTLPFYQILLLSRSLILVHVFLELLKGQMILVS